VSEHQDVPDDAAGPDAGPDPVVELLARAREACVDQPELLAALDDVEQLEQVDLARRPEVLDAVHRTLRQVLTGASRPGPTS
jgi:CHASE3 domain sensor protein